MLKKMLGFGGHNWFKIRPVQTGGMTMRQNRDFQTYSHVMVPKKSWRKKKSLVFSL